MQSVHFRVIVLTGSLVFLPLSTAGAARSVTVSAGTAPALVARTVQSPAARVGAFYFDGWSGELGNFHWGGLLGTQFSGRRPLSGWTDDRPKAVEAQLRWARAAGISFFIFDWFHEPGRSNGPINMAFETYWKLPDRAGVGAALAYVNQGGFAIPRGKWAQVVENWVTQYFVRPDYARIGGRPLLVILDEAGFIRESGGADGANAAIETVQAAARSHGLPGVFVVGGRYFDWHSEACFPRCIDTDSAFSSVRYDAIAEYTYPKIVEPRDGPRPYTDAVIAMKRLWEVIAVRSPFPHIPSIMAGFDARPMILAGQIQPREEGGWPLLDGHQTWFVRSPAQVSSFIRDAVAWVHAHPEMRVEPAPAPPVIFIQAWNELQEGSYLVPTDDDGYGYLQAVAEAIGVRWTPPEKRTLSVGASTRGTVTSRPPGIACPTTCTAPFDEGLEVSLTADLERGSTLDGWTGCRVDARSCSLVIVRDSSARALISATRQRRALMLRPVGRGTLRGRLRVLDGYSRCAFDAVRIQERRGNRWLGVAATATDPAGGFSVTLRKRPGTYRAYAPQSALDGHTCLAARSQQVTRWG